MFASELDSDQVRAALRSDSLGVVLGIALMGLASSAILLFRVRAGARDKALLYFGGFAGLYGLRLVLSTRVLPFIADPIPREVWGYTVAAINYVIPVPALLFVEHLFPDKRRSFQWLLWPALVLGLAGIAADLLLHRPDTLAPLENALALLFGGLFLIESWQSTRNAERLPLLRVGIVVFLLTALVNNLAGIAPIHLPFNPEPLGFAFFVATVGQLAARRALAGESRLRSMEQELGIARRIQSSILPAQTPANQHIAIATRYLPMNDVAGDLFDFLVIDELHLGILIADVSGHGVPAALIASMMKIAISTQLPHAGDPGLVLTGINQAISGKFKGQFVTAAYLYLDLAARRLRCATAGHPPVLLRSASGAVASLSQNGLALGLRAKSQYTYMERAFQPGDRFLLYTDGLFEAHNAAGESFGEERLRSVFGQTDAAGPGQLADAILENLSTWAGFAQGRPHEDDLTLVVADIA